MSTFEPKPFGKYFLIDKLAVGGMAEIYKAKTFGVDGFEKQLAIKKILSHYSADKEFISMLTDEAKLAVRLSHTNIVQIYDLGKVGDDYYISMEFIDGFNLRELINRGFELGEKIPVEICLYIGSEISKGLDYAHSKRDENSRPLNIVHRDISPQNILISFEGETKIVDFGIAKAALNISHTTAGILKGKVTYMSPEQALGKPVDGRTDIFSAGIILYEMITGERLFTGETQMEVLKLIQTTRLTEESLSKKIPAEIRPILAKALAFNPNDRYQTSGDFQIALTKALYSQYVDFSPKQLANLIKKWFAPELKIKRKKAEEQTRIESGTRSIMAEEIRQETLVHREESVEIIGDEMMAPTTKPEDWAKPGELKHPGGRPPLTTRKFPWPVIIAGLAVAAGLLYAFFPREPEPVPSPPPVVGEIDVGSEPSGASIFMNGNNTGEATPAIIGNLERAETYQVLLKKEGFKPWEEEIDFKEEELVTVFATLEPLPIPPADEKPVKPPAPPKAAPSPLPEKKPLPEIRPEPLPEMVKDKEPSPPPVEKTLPVKKAPPETAPAKTSSDDASGLMARIRVDSSPSGASVLVDGQKSGVTPIVIRNLRKNQTYTIVVAMPGYKSWTRSIQTSKNYMEITATLVR